MEERNFARVISILNVGDSFYIVNLLTFIMKRNEKTIEQRGKHTKKARSSKVEGNWEEVRGEEWNVWKRKVRAGKPGARGVVFLS